MIKIMLASFSAREKDWGTAGEQEKWMINNGLSGRLLSYYAIDKNQAESKRSFEFYKKNRRFILKNKVSLFLDSGAFSAWAKSIEIDIYEYINFIKENIQYLDTYSVLDFIKDPEQTLENQKIMEGEGLNPLPCFHYGEDPKYLLYYLQNHDYISLGGMVPISNQDLASWLDEIFVNYLCDQSGTPTHKIHGFGMTSLKLMLRYPWYSVDSTSWVLTGRFGSVFVPQIKMGKYIYDENSWKIAVSNRSTSLKDAGKHINTFSEMERNQILKYFDLKGFKLGRSEFREESSNYKLQEGERWFGKAEADSQRGYKGDRSGDVEKGWTKERTVETVIELGLSNDYKQRDEMNIIYFLDLEGSMPDWPWAWKPAKPTGFGMRKRT